MVKGLRSFGKGAKVQGASLPFYSRFRHKKGGKLHGAKAKGPSVRGHHVEGHHVKGVTLNSYRNIGRKSRR